MRNLLRDKIIPIGDPPFSMLQRFYWFLAGDIENTGGNVLRRRRQN